MPCGPSWNGTPRRLPCSGSPRLANTDEIASCSSPRKLTPNLRALWSWPWQRVFLSTETIMSRGSSDTDTTPFAVMPWSQPSTLVVITVTPVAKLPQMSRKPLESRLIVVP